MIEWLVLILVFLKTNAQDNVTVSPRLDLFNGHTASGSVNTSTLSPSLHNKEVRIGLLFGIPPVGIVLYFSLLYLLLHNRKKYSNVFYFFVLAVSFNDLYWLFFFLYQGACLTLDRCPGGELFNTVVTTIAIYGFYVCMLLNLVLSWNRFCAIYFFVDYETIFFTKRMALVYLLVVLTGSALCNIPGFTHLYKYYPLMGSHGFVILPSEQYIQISKVVDLVLSYILHILIVVLYVAAFIKYRREHAQLTQNQKTNLRFLYQAMASAMPCLMFINCHHFNLPTFELILAELCASINPFVYLWFNSELRADFLRMIKGRSQNSVYSTTENLVT